MDTSPQGTWKGDGFYLCKKITQVAVRKDFAISATEIGWLGFPALAESTEMGQHPCLTCT